VTRAALLASFLALVLSGCASSAGKADGHYVNYRWGTTESECVNGSCTYGSNHKTFSITLACDIDPTLSWDANNWHGSITANVKDATGAQVASHTVSSNGKGSQPVTGQPGTWTFEGWTSNANGNAEIRLACG